MRAFYVSSMAGLVAASIGLAACDVGEAPPTEGPSELGETHDATTVCPGESLIPGIDVSYYQGDIDWNAVAGSGMKFAITRLNDGSFHDPKFQPNWDGIKAAGMIRGVYQFFEPDSNVESQAQLVVDSVGMLGAGDLPAMIDVEKAGSLSKAAYADEIRQWIDIVEAGTGKPPIIYTGKYFWQDNVASSDFNDYPLIDAAYPDACQPPNPPPGQGCGSCPNLADQFDDWQFWQYTSSNHVPGIAGNVDTNVFNGTQADLDALAGGGLAAALVSVDVPSTMAPGETFTLKVTYKNVGNAPWDTSTKLGTTAPRDRMSVFHDASWPSENRLAAVASSVDPGATYTFETKLHAPTTEGAYTESFGLLEEQVAWFSDQGGPADDAVTLHLQVVAPPPSAVAGPSATGVGSGAGAGTGGGGGAAGDDTKGSCDCQVVGASGAGEGGLAAMLGLAMTTAMALTRAGRTSSGSARGRR